MAWFSRMVLRQASQTCKFTFLIPISKQKPYIFNPHFETKTLKSAPHPLHCSSRDPANRASTLSLSLSAMANVALASLLLCFLFVSSTTLVISDSPFVVAHKKVTLNRLKSGSEQVSVAIDIYNQGSATAYDVSLIDDSWAKDVFDLVSGNISKTWERLDPGSIVSHSFVLESKVRGMYHGAPAVIKFRIPTKSALQEAFSTPTLPLDILADRPPEKKFDFAKRLLAKYGSLVTVISIMTIFVYLVATPSKNSAAKAGKKRR